METQLTIFDKRKSDNWQGLTKLQPETEKFMSHFQTRSKVIAFFCPARWSYCVENIGKCITAPSVKLSQLATLYQDANLARELVASQITGLYSMSTGTYQLNDAVVQQAAEMFVAHYGKTCSVYDMMLYFAHYMIEFKGNTYQLDVQDVLKQFKAKYRDWRSRLDVHEETPRHAPRATGEATGLEALKELVIDKIKQGDDVRTMSLYVCGIITDKLIKECEQIVNGDIF